MGSSSRVVEVPNVKASQSVEEVSKNIVDIAVEDGRFTTLVRALQPAEFDGVLSR